MTTWWKLLMAGALAVASVSLAGQLGTALAQGEPVDERPWERGEEPMEGTEAALDGGMGGAGTQEPQLPEQPEFPEPDPSGGESEPIDPAPPENSL